MSRIGNNPITLPNDVTFYIKENVINVKGKLGELTTEIAGEITIKI